MSGQELQKVEDDLNMSVSKFIKALWIVGGLMFAVGTWTATQQVLLTMNTSGDQEAHKKIDSAKAKLSTIEVWQAATEANRYTVKDHSEFEKQLAQDRLLQEKRIQRLEDNQARITDTQEEIQKLLRSVDTQIRELTKSL
ncbi:MAG: hypothetical protein CMO55_06985 [Verrucomicrobiales bacterium]|nr:hypothetical protein [Verrucomicrobiales bacterium]